MAISNSDLEALDAAIASGALSVEFDGRKVTYQNTAALLVARDHVAKVLNSTGQIGGPQRFRFTFTTSRGD